MLIDLVAASVTHSVHAAQAMSAASTTASSAGAPGSTVPVDGILPIPGFCDPEHGTGCQLTLQTLEVLLRFALVALHPLSDTGSFTQGPLWKRRPGAAMPRGGAAGAGCRC